MRKEMTSVLLTFQRSSEEKANYPLILTKMLPADPGAHPDRCIKAQSFTTLFKAEDSLLSRMTKHDAVIYIKKTWSIAKRKSVHT